MRRALALAARGWGQTAPNPMVGAVVVRDGLIAGEGCHERFGSPHAEVNALAAAGERARGAHMYVSLEPCAHHGRNPPCAEALIAAGISAVTIAAPDPTPQAGGGAELLRRAGVAVTIGVEEEAARELNAPFFHAAANTERPWVILKLAISRDGAIAGPPDDANAGTEPAPRWLTGERARAEVHRMRAGVDAIAVGSGTVLADDPELTVRHVAPPRRPPLRVVFDRRGRTPIGSRLIRSARDVPALIVVDRNEPPAASALRESGAEVLASAGLPDALRQLRARGVHALLVEGGAELAGSFLDAGLVDRLVLFQAPVVLGAGARDAFSAVRDRKALESGLRVLQRREFGDDVMTVYAVAER